VLILIAIFPFFRTIFSGTGRPTVAVLLTLPTGLCPTPSLLLGTRTGTGLAVPTNLGPLPLWLLLKLPL